MLYFKVIPVAFGIGVFGVSIAVMLIYAKKKKKITLVDNTVKCPLKLIEKDIISSDTIRFRFALPSPDHTLGLPVGQHITLSCKIDGQMVVRPYTPVTNDEVKGYMDLVIKDINLNLHEVGKMSQYLEHMKIGDFIDVSGPFGPLVYKGQGIFEISPNNGGPLVVRRMKNVNLIAGGSGITPMLQIIHAILMNKCDMTHISLLYANQTAKDILLREELEYFQSCFPSRFSIWYTVNHSDTDWKYSTGFIDYDMIKDHLLPPSDTTFVLMCGPPAMINIACNPNLDKVGYSKDLRFTY